MNGGQLGWYHFYSNGWCKKGSTLYACVRQLLLPFPQSPWPCSSHSTSVNGISVSTSQTRKLTHEEEEMAVDNNGSYY